jgi:hypothetical protein
MVSAMTDTNDNGGAARERFCYQLIEGAGGYQIAVLTPMG